MGDREWATVGTLASNTRTRFPGGGMLLASSFPDIITDQWGQHGIVGKGQKVPFWSQQACKKNREGRWESFQRVSREEGPLGPLLSLDSPGLTVGARAISYAFG